MSKLIIIIIIIIRKEFDLFLRTTFNIPQNIVFSWNTVWETLDQKMNKCSSVLSFVPPKSLFITSVSAFTPLNSISLVPSWICPFLSIPTALRSSHHLSSCRSQLKHHLFKEAIPNSPTELSLHPPVILLHISVFSSHICSLIYCLLPFWESKNSLRVRT